MGCYYHMQSNWDMRHVSLYRVEHNQYARTVLASRLEWQPNLVYDSAVIRASALLWTVQANPKARREP